MPDRVFAQAAAELRGQHEHGRLLWSVNGHRAYIRDDAGSLHMTLLSPAAPTLVYIVEGASADALT